MLDELLRKPNSQVWVPLTNTVQPCEMGCAHWVQGMSSPKGAYSEANLSKQISIKIWNKLKNVWRLAYELVVKQNSHPKFYLAILNFRSRMGKLELQAAKNGYKVNIWPTKVNHQIKHTRTILFGTKMKQIKQLTEA